MLKKSLATSMLLLATTTFAAPSAPFASGVSGDLSWEVRFNLPRCQHDGQRTDAWCLSSDQRAATKKNGVADKLKEWAYDKNIKSLHLAYFSFSNKTIRYALCKASEYGKNVNVYLDQSNAMDLEYWFEDNCNDASNIKVTGLGVPFGSEGGHLQHAKVFMASESSELKTFEEMNSEERAQAQQRKLKFTSSSANMSSNGLALHFENWMFLETNENKNLAQQNICMFKSFGSVSNAVIADTRQFFAEQYEKCIKKIEDRKRKDIDFYVVPATKSMPRPFDGMKNMIYKTRDYLRIGIHRLTTSSVYKWLIGGADRRGVDVKVIMDDDTLRTGIYNGGDAHDVGVNDVKAYRFLRDKTDTEVSFMETNAVTMPSLGGVPHLFHNKFIVADGKALFQGAGNFTGRALNSYGHGNYEQFYIIRVPEIVEAYEKGWNELRKRSTLRADHPVGDNQDIDIDDLGGF